MSIAKAVNTQIGDGSNYSSDLVGFFCSNVTDLCHAGARIDRTSDGIVVTFQLRKADDLVEAFIRELPMTEVDSLLAGCHSNSAIIISRKSSTSEGSVVFADEGLAWFRQMVKNAKNKKGPLACVTSENMN